MKKVLLLSVLGILIGCSGMAQRAKHDTLFIDARSGTLGNKNMTTRYGNSVSFTISNVNPLLTKASTKVIDVNFETEVPVFFSNTSDKTGDVLKLSSDQINDVVKQLKASDSVKTKAAPDLNSLITIVASYNEDLKGLDLLTERLAMIEKGAPTQAEEKNKLVNEINKKIESLNKKSKSIEAQIKKLKSTFDGQSTKLGKLSSSLDELQKAISEHLRKIENFNLAKREFMAHYRQFCVLLQRLTSLSQIDKYIKSQLKDYVVDSGIIKQNLIGYLRSFRNTKVVEADGDKYVQSLRDDAFNTITMLNDEYQIISFMYDSLSKTLDKDSVFVKGKLVDEKNDFSLDILSSKAAVLRKKYFKEQYEYATKQVTKLSNDSIRNQLIFNINAGLDLYQYVIKNDFTISEGPYEVYEDSKKFLVSLKNVDGKSIKDFDEIEVKTYGGVKVDFSSGYLLSFIGDDDYSTVKGADGKLVGFRANPKDPMTHSVGALINVYERSSRGIKFGGSIGFSLPTDNKFNFYLGGSILCLDKNRLIFTAGIAMVQVNRLNTALLEYDESDGQYKFIPGNEFSDPSYKKVYKPAPFIGITYNIFSLNKAKN